MAHLPDLSAAGFQRLDEPPLGNGVAGIAYRAKDLASGACAARARQLLPRACSYGALPGWAGPMRMVRLRIRTQCPVTPLMPCRVSGELVAIKYVSRINVRTHACCHASRMRLPPHLRS
jgi:hypothetical protein